MHRRLNQHIDSEKLSALASLPPSGSGGQRVPHELREADQHVRSCPSCREKLHKYQCLLTWEASPASRSGLPGSDCPAMEEADWQQVATGLWPELKAQQLFRHAAMCDHCGPRLRDAARFGVAHPGKAIPERAIVPGSARATASVFGNRAVAQATRWVLAALAVAVVLASWKAKPGGVSARTLSGPQIAELAVATHQQYARGAFPLDFRTDSRQALNEWLQSSSGLALSSPASAAASGELPAYQLRGAHLLKIGRGTAAYISYERNDRDADRHSVSLMIAPESLGAASGGVEVSFPKIRFHYSMVNGYRVVTWTVHGLTYALVSQERRDSQRACQVCHSSSNDPALKRMLNSPRVDGSSLAPVWQ